MKHFLLLLALLAAPWARPARAAGVPPRPVPFTFVTDQAKLLAPAEAKKLDNGLRHYAEKTGNQVVVVTVPSLDGADIADYGRKLGTAWGVGQRDKDNGVVVLLAGKEHKLTIQAGSGLRSAITPELTQRIISQEMTPAFKTGDYFGGLRTGLNTLMAAADPSAAQAAKTTTSAASREPAAGASLAGTSTAADPVAVQPTEAPASSGGLGLGTLVIGAVVLIGGIWLVRKLFQRNNNAAGASQAPNFMGNRPAASGPNFGAPNAPNAGYGQPGYGAPMGGGGSGSGIGGILATGAAAAAGAYIGNRMSSHGSDDTAQHFNNGDNSSLGAGAAGVAGAAGTGAAGDYFSSRGGESGGGNSEPDYFSDANTADSSGDYFSDNSSYDDTSSDDTGGGGFDSSDDNQGSW